MNDIERIILDETAIAAAVKRLGKRISADYDGKKPLLVGVLKGSFVFLADLMRAVSLPCELDFITARSYGQRAESSGVVKITKDLDTDISGRDVIIVEDILESANCLFSVREILRERNPASLKICAFLVKDVPRAVPLEADYKCFDVENEFLVGYGLDYAERYRNLPYIGVLKKEIYS